jgi:signal transduction histidine kinase
VSAGGGRAAPDAWERVVVGWHAAFWLVLAITGLAVFVDSPVSGARAWAGAAALVGLAAAYLALGAPAAVGRSQRRAAAYVATLVVALPVLLWVDGATSFLLFLAYPQVWMLVDGRLRAALTTGVVALAALAGFVVSAGGSPGALRQAGPAIAISFLFSLTLGLWISSVVEQSADRAALIAQLESTRAELAVAERAAGAAEERATLARDIHDTLAQGFTSVLMLSQIARRELGDGGAPARASARLETLEDVARTGLAEARSLVAASSPVDVHGSDLAGALRRLAGRFAEETGVAVDVQVADLGADPVGPLTPERAVVLLRSAQEGLANVRKHAGATRVTLRLHQDGDLLRLELVDDGVGWDATTAGDGFGLDGLRRRAAEIGGRVGLGRAGSGGTRLAVEVPSR